MRWNTCMKHIIIIGTLSIVECTKITVCHLGYIADHSGGCNENIGLLTQAHAG